MGNADLRDLAAIRDISFAEIEGSVVAVVDAQLAVPVPHDDGEVDG